MEKIDDALVLCEVDLSHNSFNTGWKREARQCTSCDISIPDDEGMFTVGLFTKNADGLLLSTEHFTKVRYIHTKLCNRHLLEQPMSTIYN